MSDKKIIIGDKTISDISDDISISNSDSTILASGKAYDSVYKELTSIIQGTKQGQITALNQRLIEALDALQEIIDENNDSLFDIQDDDLSALRTVLERGNLIRADIVNSGIQYELTETGHDVNEYAIDCLEQFVAGLITDTGHSAIVTVGGDATKFYPIVWPFPTGYVGTVRIERDNTLPTGHSDLSMSLFFKCYGFGSGVDVNESHEFRITDFTEANGISLRLASQDVFNTPSGLDPVKHGTYSCPIGNCVFLRGNTQYKITCSDVAILAAIQVSADNVVSNSLHEINGYTYNVSCIDESIITNIISDERLKWLFRQQHVINTNKVNAVTGMNVPVDSTTGNYSITWGTTSTADAEYVLEQATDSNFSDTVELYSGPNRQLEFIDHGPGIFYYRVKAIKSGLAGSDWVVGSDTCSVVKYLSRPTGLTVPEMSTNDGEFTANWAGTLPVNAEYVLEYALQHQYLDAVSIYQGTDTSKQFVHLELPQDRYYFRVKIIKENYTDSSYFGGTTCLVIIVAHAPDSVSVPDENESGSFTTTWAPTTTADGSYILERATESDFSDATQFPITTNQYDNIDLLTDTYYFRVKTVCVGMTDSDWVESIPCVVTRTIVKPSEFIVPSDNSTGDFMVRWTRSPESDVTYIVQYSNDSDFGDDAIVEIQTTGTTHSYTDIYPDVLYFRIKAIKDNMYDSPWEGGSTSITVTRTVETPMDIVVPSDNSDGTYTISWTATETPEVMYTLEEFTDSDSPDSTVTRSIDCTDAFFTFLEQVPGTYYYRVRASKEPDWYHSDWGTGETGCEVERTVELPSLTVPPNDHDGDGVFNIVIGPSETAGASYVIEVTATDGFSDEINVAAGSSLTIAMLDLDPDIYSFKIMATKPEWENSDWVDGSDPCDVRRIIEPPTNFIVTDSNLTGDLTVAWTASPEEDVAYVLQRATDDLFPTESTLEVQVTGTSYSYTDVQPGEHYFRVKATKSEWRDSDWAIGSCEVNRQPAPPISLSVPSNSPIDTVGLVELTIVPPSVASDISNYVIERSTQSTFDPSDTVEVYSGSGLNPTITETMPGTYWYRVRAIGLDPATWDPSPWTVGGSCEVEIKVAKPSSLTVPETNDDGSPVLNIVASSSNVTYVVNRARASNFSDATEIYRGGGLVVIGGSNLNPGTYYYQVRAIRNNWKDSDWTNSHISCVVSRTVVNPTGLTVPPNSAGGNIALTIGASSTQGCVYVVERALNQSFTQGRQTVYTGQTPSCSAPVGGVPNRYYFRVRGIKTNNWKSSAWVPGNTSCLITPKLRNPTYLSIPPRSVKDALMPVVIGASPDAPDYYGIYMSRYSDMANQYQVYQGPAQNPKITIGSVIGASYFRVKAFKSQWASSDYVGGNRPTNSLRYGDDGMFTGGTQDNAYLDSAHNVKISTGAISFNSGNVTKRSYHGMASDSHNDNYIVHAGRKGPDSGDLLQSSVYGNVSTSSVATVGGVISTCRLSLYLDNDVEGQYVVLGGYKSSGNRDVLKGHISTRQETLSAVGDNTAVYGSVGGNKEDVGFFIPGAFSWTSSGNYRRSVLDASAHFIISTEVRSETTESISTRHFSSSVDNNSGDTMIVVNGRRYLKWTIYGPNNRLRSYYYEDDITSNDKYIMSTGVLSMGVSDLSEPYGIGGCQSGANNSINSEGVIMGGNASVTKITIDTNATATDIGSLPNPNVLMNPAATSNG